MLDDAGTIDLPDVAVLCLDRATGQLCELNPAGRALLGLDDDDQATGSWWTLLGIPGSDSALAQAVHAGHRAAFPPTVICPPGARDCVVSGYFFPQYLGSRELSLLLLFPTNTAEPGPDDFAPASWLAQAIAPGDVFAVLGVDHPGSAGEWRPADASRRMMDIRRGLLQIVPAGDDVGLPEGATLPMILRGVGLEEARDISRALLSHLGPIPVDREDTGAQARICIGLALCRPGQGPMNAVTAANRALLRRQQGGGELIGVADELDEAALIARAVSTEGLFSPPLPSPEEHAFLGELVALAADTAKAGDYIAQVLALMVRQRNVAAAAVYRRLRDDSYEYAGGRLAVGADTGETAESRLPRAFRGLAKKLRTRQLREEERILYEAAGSAAFPLRQDEVVLGALMLQYADAESAGNGFAPGVAGLHHLATELSFLAEWRQARDNYQLRPQPAVQPMEYQLDGYVDDNLEGAIDQAVFLAGVDIPVAVIGPRGTGKLYVAKVIHQESGAAPEMLAVIDCREFRGRKQALGRVARELETSAGKTLVFKSPHLMHADAQLKLARQISSRILADTSPPRYLRTARFVALFPDDLEHLVQHGGLQEKLASVFSGYPIVVPPLKDRKRAVLRWAHKILAQESALRDRRISGFTPDAEQAILSYEWPGNISEMRQTIAGALDKTGKDWITPVDLALFRGLSAARASAPPPKRAFLQASLEEAPEEASYAPTGLDEVGTALGEALHNLLETDTLKPLGAWLDDEVVLAVCERFRGNLPGAAQFLHTRARNISRWMPKILARDHERSTSSLWQPPRRLIRQWIKESAPMAEPPQQQVQAILLSHVVSQCGNIAVAERARIMGVSTPTYQKRLQELLHER